MIRPMGAPAGATAAILVIGEEILAGKVEEENARFLVRELRALGVAVRRVEVVPDDTDEIVAALRALAARFDHVFTSGGIGPTHDDLTLGALARAFDMRLARRPELAALIRGAAGDAFLERDLRMADIPEGAELVYGDAPGVWPVIAVRNVYAFPGVPAILRRKFTAIRERFRSAPIHGRALYSRDGEAAIAPALDAAAAAFPQVFVGSYPRLDASDHRVKITVDGRDAAAVEAATARLIAALGDAIVGQE